jgi:predicted O-linked N-acetylglucosamine transferase (SPINDLY family)
MGRRVTSAPASTPEAWHALAVASRNDGKPQEAGQAFAEALQLNPDHVPSLVGMARLRFSPRESASGLRLLQRALELDPDSAEARLARAFFHHILGDEEAALADVTTAIQLDGTSAEAYSLLSTLYMHLGRVADAVEAAGAAVRGSLDDPARHGAWLFMRNYLEPDDPHAELQTICAFDRHCAPLAPAEPVRPHDPDPDRRLRIGYVSPDFRWHPVAQFARPVLAAHDREQVEVICYAEYSQADLSTLQFQDIADQWVPTKDITDQDLATRIRDDRVDILIDLAGHSAGNRLLAFARRPAPIQASWLGYCNSTGLNAIGYRFTDAECDPPGLAETLHRETLIRLSRGFHVYQPPNEVTPLRPAPCLRTGCITFASFNNFRKHTPEVVALWARVLRAVPGSRLLMKSHDYRHPGVRGWFLDRFAEQGVPPDRVRLVPAQLGTFRHFDLFGQVDICLDPFPYNGTTTTCDALWMGVPVVALRGSLHRSRVGHSLLTRIGRPEWSAENSDAFVDICRRLAADPQALNALRHPLREQMRTSPLGDGPGLARDLEAGYRDLWRRTLAAT